MSWVREPSESSHCLWISGIPGVGKSTLMATLATKLEDSRSLVAQFFVNRTFEMTSQPNNLFPTIASQLSKKSPIACVAIHTALQEQPSIARQISQDQARKLFLDTVCALAASQPKMPIVLMIDALDEFSRDRKQVISLLSSVMSDENLPPNLKLIISSRPEDDVVQALRVDKKLISLETADSTEEVGAFIVDRVREVVPEEWGTWPSDMEIENLRVNADGHFQWATTAIRYIEDRIKKQGKACRATVLADISKGMSSLDNLYTLILTNIFPNTEQSRCTRFREVVGALIVLAEPLPIGQLRQLLSIDDEFDVLHLFQSLRSLFIAGTARVDEHTTPQMHKSVFDFLTQRVHESLRITVPIHHSAVARSIFRVMEGLRFNIADLPTSYRCNAEMIDQSTVKEKIPPYLVYACNFWGYHVEKSEFEEYIEKEMGMFLRTRFLFWLEVMSLYNKMSLVGLALECAIKWVSHVIEIVTVLLSEGVISRCMMRNSVLSFKMPENLWLRSMAQYREVHHISISQQLLLHQVDPRYGKNMPLCIQELLRLREVN
jgi:hypothetical protein